MLEKAICVAAEAHKGQKRKGSGIPYIFHPLGVGAILAENGCSMEVITAGILHDTVEDTDLTLSDIENMFGKEVARLVEGAGESNRHVPNVTWEVRKENTLYFLKNKADVKIKQIVCADKLHNIKSTEADYKRIGEKIWDVFNAPYEKQKRYYRSLLECFFGIEDYPMYRELKETVERVFGAK
ncbi:MAG: HD domain-containing protein [Clostridia bacterium]|nr:HD domain-containing protein [Clostridiaceae bacterium]